MCIKMQCAISRLNNQKFSGDGAQPPPRRTPPPRTPPPRRRLAPSAPRYGPAQTKILPTPLYVRRGDPQFGDTGCRGHAPPPNWAVAVAGSPETRFPDVGCRAKFGHSRSNNTSLSRELRSYVLPFEKNHVIENNTVRLGTYDFLLLVIHGNYGPIS